MKQDTIGKRAETAVFAPETDMADFAGEVVADIVETHGEMLVEKFYGAFFGHSEAGAFLNHDVVQERLGRSLQKWLQELFPADGAANSATLSEHQRLIGEVHARIRIPIHLVMEGAEHLKAGITECLMTRELPAATRCAALILLNQRIDIAMRLMSAAYVTWTARKVRTDEAYRIFSIGQDLNLERESQRASLMEWSQSVLFGLVGDADGQELLGIQRSPFGLWFRHRAGVIFQGAPGLIKIEEQLRRVDSELLPQLKAEKQQRSNNFDRALQQLQEAIEEIKFLLASLFQGVSGMETGVDPLTRALNRRFLPSILGREIALAKENGTPFSILMVDIDHFKAINDRHGHQGGDVVLKEMASIMIENLRLSDFIFRYGGEEFLIALVETSAEDAVNLAERIRSQFQQSAIRLSDDDLVHATVSIGIATFDGHPDYDYLIAAADKALYEAKSTGRNQTVMARAD